MPKKHDFVEKIYPIERQINSTAYLGDLLVTSYSLHSRNRRFGNFIGSGHSVKAAKNEMKMIAEGFHASSCVNELNKKYKVSAPIADAVFQIVHNGKSPEKTISALSSVMH